MAETDILILGAGPYYPILAPDATALYKKYEALAAQEKMSASWGAWPPTAMTTWTRWSAWRWLNLKD
jgi:UDP-galactopyranose mutase